MSLFFKLFEDVQRLKDLYEMLRDIAEMGKKVLEERDRKYVGVEGKKEVKKVEKRRENVYSDFYIKKAGASTIISTNDYMFIAFPGELKLNLPKAGKVSSVNVITSSLSFINKGDVEYVGALMKFNEEAEKSE